MPRKALTPAPSDLDAAPGGVAAVDRALALLNAWQPGDRNIALVELARRCGLYKSTASRLLASLEHAGFVVKGADGYGLGSALPRLAGLYGAGFSYDAVVVPALRELVEATQESAAFHVRRGDQRVCLFRVDSPQLLRDHIRVGDVLPLDRGAGGRVLRAFEGGTGATGALGASGAVYDQIRRDGVVVLSGDRVPELTGISAPVFGADQALLGALTLTLPTARHLPELRDRVRQAAWRLTAQLGGGPDAVPMRAQ